jgi:hypothetical protein
MWVIKIKKVEIIRPKERNKINKYNVVVSIKGFLIGLMLLILMGSIIRIELGNVYFYIYSCLITGIIITGIILLVGGRIK